MFRYTADNNGYNAQVTYLEGQIQGDYTVQSTQPTPLAPALASAQPIYNYYKTLQEHQNNHENSDNRIYNHYNVYPTTTPTPYYGHSEATPLGHYRNHIQNVDIKTYNTGPHREVGRDGTVVTPLVNRFLIFPTTPAPYTDIHVLPTPRTLAYSTSSPYRNVVSRKSTNVLPGFRYYGDYDYGNADGQASTTKNSYINSNTALYYKVRK